MFVYFLRAIYYSLTYLPCDYSVL